MNLIFFSFAEFVRDMSRGLFFICICFDCESLEESK